MRALALALVIAACGKDSAPPPPPNPAPPPAAKLPLPAGVPDSPAGRQLAWVMDAIVAHHGTVDKKDIAQHFGPRFLAQVPADQLIAILGALSKQLADAKVSDVKATTPTHLVAHLEAGAGDQRVIVDVDPRTEQIEGLLFQPARVFASYDDAQAALTKLAPHASLLVAAVDHGTCKPLHAVDADAELAIGSAFKLWVLLGLADQVIAGKRGWDDPIAVDDNLKSLPSGITQNDAAGTKLPLKTLAERMISISDNTATDHVLAAIGRAAAETALRVAKHAKPELDTPFLSTREMFLLKLSADRTGQDHYLTLPAAKRRDYLDKQLAGQHPSIAGIEKWTTARRIDRIEWFASGSDLCRVMATLWQRAQDPKAAAVLEILSKNPGTPIDRAIWPFVGFKGGSEPGVLDLTWLLRRDDQKWFVITMTLDSDEGGVVDENQALSVVSGVLALAAKSDR